VTSGSPQPPIIVGYDPKLRDRAPVRFGVAASRFTGAPLIVASVCADWRATQDCEELMPEAGQALEDLKAEVDAEVEIRELRAASASRALHEAADSEGASLLVVGSTHQATAGRLLPGSTAERLLHGAPCAIGVTPHGWEPRGRLDPIGVAYVESEEGLEALRAGHDLARKAGATLRVLTAVSPHLGIPAGADTYKAGRAGTSAQDVEGALELRAEQGVRSALAQIDGEVTAEVDVFVDDPADALVRVSEHLDLLVCGSRGYGPLRAVLLGGVTRRVIAGAACPVIVLPRGVKAPLAALAAAPGSIGAA
jgi:nucleotide-binding universal stress UspA family protein